MSMKRRKQRETGIETAMAYGGLFGGLLFGRYVKRRFLTVGFAILCLIGMFVGTFFAEENGWSETMDIETE